MGRLPDILLEGIGGIGKSTELKIAYNTLIDVFHDMNNYDDSHHALAYNTTEA